jgi:hypothetical protein
MENREKRERELGEKGKKLGASAGASVESGERLTRALRKGMRMRE